METKLMKRKIESGEKVFFPKETPKKDLAETFKPLHDAHKKVKEDEVVGLIHRLRKEWKFQDSQKRAKS